MYTEDPFGNLLKFLKDLQPGLVPSSQVSALEPLLAAVWDDLPGSSAGGMEGYKVRRNAQGERMQKVLWNPMTLCFEIERHPWTGVGSASVDLQQWEVDLASKTANLRNLSQKWQQRAGPVKVEPIARAIVDDLLAVRTTEFLTFRADGSARLETGSLSPRLSK